MNLSLAFVILLAGSSAAFAEAEASNKIDCSQFAKVGPITYNEKGTAVFDFGKMKDVHLTKTPVQKGAFSAQGQDLFTVIDKACGSK